MQRYQLRLNGLRENTGQIKATSLRDVLDALIKTAERSTRLLVTGKGGEKGKKPGWLEETVDFTVTGLESGSTVLAIDVPRLRETAYEKFAQQGFWNEQPSLDDTSLDLAARAIKEAQTDDPAGDYFDSSVLEAILKFWNAAGGAGVHYELISQDDGHSRFTLDERICDRVKERLNNIPSPRAFIVSGRLDEIKHGSGRFRLLVGADSQLLGRLDSTKLDVEDLRFLWGRQTIVEGMVYFKVNGQPRLIEARRIGSNEEGDSVFQAMPAAEAPGLQRLTPAREKYAGSPGFMELWGAWPGDEPIEELLGQLD